MTVGDPVNLISKFKSNFKHGKEIATTQPPEINWERFLARKGQKYVGQIGLYVHGLSNFLLLRWNWGTPFLKLYDGEGAILLLDAEILPM